MCGRNSRVVENTTENPDPYLKLINGERVEGYGEVTVTKLSNEHNFRKVEFTCLNIGKTDYVIASDHCNVPSEFILLLKRGNNSTGQYGDGKRYVNSSYSNVGGELYIWRCVKCNANYSVST